MAKHSKTLRRGRGRSRSRNHNRSTRKQRGGIAGVPNRLQSGGRELQPQGGAKSPIIHQGGRTRTHTRTHTRTRARTRARARAQIGGIPDPYNKPHIFE